MNEPIKFMNTKDVAKALGCSLPAARAVMMRADFPLVKVGKNYKVKEEAFLDSSNGAISGGYKTVDSLSFLN